MEKMYLWNNRSTHDKVYAVMYDNKEKKLYKVWGRRGSTLRYDIINNPAYGLYNKVAQEKIGKGYDEIYGDNREEVAIIKAIDDVVEMFAKDVVSTTIKPKAKKDKAKAEVKKYYAICKDNTGMEEQFEEDIEYLLVSESPSFLIVQDIFGNEVKVLPERFKLIEADSAVVK